VGESVLGIDGTGPFYQLAAAEAAFAGPLTPVLATLSRDGDEIYLVIANGSWKRAVPCRVALQNFHVASAKGIVITSDNMDGKPLLEEKEDAVSEFPISATAEAASCTLPPHSIVFVTLAQAGP
jgi:hypothetical protein